MTEIDNLFPISLFDKESLSVLALKLEKYGTLSCVREQNRIVAMCAGYANDIQNRQGYISVVAVLPEYSNKGYGKVAVQGFLKKTKGAGMSSVYLYADSENSAALHMYKKLGFSEWNIVVEPRPKDKHLIIQL